MLCSEFLYWAKNESKRKKEEKRRGKEGSSEKKGKSSVISENWRRRREGPTRILHGRREDPTTMQSAETVKCCQHTPKTQTAHPFPVCMATERSTMLSWCCNQSNISVCIFVLGQSTNHQQPKRDPVPRSYLSFASFSR